MVAFWNKTITGSELFNNEEEKPARTKRSIKEAPLSNRCRKASDCFCCVVSQCPLFLCCVYIGVLWIPTSFHLEGTRIVFDGCFGGTCVCVCVPVDGLYCSYHCSSLVCQVSGFILSMSVHGVHYRFFIRNRNSHRRMVESSLRPRMREWIALITAPPERLIRWCFESEWIYSETNIGLKKTSSLIHSRSYSRTFLRLFT